MNYRATKDMTLQYYYGDGVTKGKVDSRLSSAQFTYLVNGPTFAAGLQQVSGDSDAV
ncbi:hypothetical protein QN400_07040 [Pseudomonas sp. RTC3]|uniref:hypothetical protein n=1 Tax=unclassified Pseudomonas TaxID=196821 RepID=UPI002B3ECEC4|nr:hypothetical protein [Pseudomonas sp. RTB2]MEB0019998.1 hypothetical protein [Pseudomonas sp. RTB3]MEB0027505.1 hypothetical protein [Pseudomonas sp. MH9.2]MEB0061777.1 hypothetical protein [Pseudomonas sp. RTC3]MEB0150399.1 hypothetical protein [Pseudomonas sp. CCC2.2]MEB0239686.1 hypothetical protein [Pseudomonas sp. 5C2]MEB0270431.1 hypothetical protein [Pseudomonas sp. 5B4]MEE3507467.1 hypothetical protein [Pseudomonas sp. 10C3]